MKLPLKFRILQLTANEQPLSNVDIATRIAAEYPGERQTIKSLVEHHLTAFQTTGIMASTPLSLSSDGALIHELALTDYGVGRLRFLPKRFKVPQADELRI